MSNETYMINHSVKKTLQIILLTVSVFFALFQLILPIYGFLPIMRTRALHLAFAFIIIFLGGKSGKIEDKNLFKRTIDIALLLTGVGITLYVFVEYPKIIEQYGVATGNFQVIMGIILILLILEAARRMIKPALPTIVLLFLLYAIFGHLIPGKFSHPKYDIFTLVSTLFLTTGGIWGLLLGVSADVIAIFVFLGAFIVNTGGGTGFMKLSVKAAGKYIGGPAKVSTISSALFGSISGSASANVATTGSFTIPMMKRLGYKPELAAAVEAVASTGGQIMPPIMGAGAFVMAELIETPYIQIALRALVPAILYFFAVGVGIHFYSKRAGYKGLSPSEIPDARETIMASWFFIIPFGVLAFWLFKRYTPQFAAFWATMSTLPLALFSENWKLEIKKAPPKIKTAVLTGAKQAALIASITASAQIIIAIIALTGLGVKITSSILSISEGNLFISLILIGITSIILGMEVPTTAAYIVAVVVGGPVLVKFGLPPIAAHLFVFYYAILSAVTPPVCGAVFIASGMAESNWVTTAKQALKLSFAAFILPFIFVYDHGLLLIGNAFDIITSIIRATLAITLISAGFMGYFRNELGRIKRSLMITAGILLIFKMLPLNGIGLIIGVLIFILKQPTTGKIPSSK